MCKAVSLLRHSAGRRLRLRLLRLRKERRGLWLYRFLVLFWDRWLRFWLRFLRRDIVEASGLIEVYFSVPPFFLLVFGGWLAEALASNGWH